MFVFNIKILISLHEKHQTYKMAFLTTFQNIDKYSIHQPKGDAAAGNQRTGYLLKRSEGRIRNTWQKRRCQIHDGFLKIFHADESKDPARVNLLTCQMKTSSDDRQCFDVVSYNRTYHFQVNIVLPELLLILKMK